MSATKELFYATLGFGDLAVEKARKAQKNLDFNKLSVPRNLKDLRTEAEKFSTSTLDLVNGRYRKLVRRGEKTYKSIRNAAPTRRAVDQTKSAKAQTKAAVTSVKKAANAAADATKDVSTKVG